MSPKFIRIVHLLTLFLTDFFHVIIILPLPIPIIQMFCKILTYDLRGCQLQEEAGDGGVGRAQQLCEALDGVVCAGSCNNTFYKEVECKWTNEYQFDTALLLSVFLGMFGADR